MVNFEKVPLGEHNYYHRYNPRKKERKTLGLIILILLIFFVYFYNKKMLDFIKVNFIPLPWGFLVFWGIIIAIILKLLIEFVFDGRIPSWLIWVLVAVGVIMAFQYKIPYKIVSIDDIYASCDNSTFKIKNNLFGLGQLAISLNCIEYRSSQCRFMCTDKMPVCHCEANIIDIVFHQQGDWFLGSGIP